MRIVFAAMILAALGIGDAAAQDNGEKLVRLFEGTCGKKPASGEAMDALAQGFGYVSQNGPIPPDDPTRDPEDLGFWKIPDQGRTFALDAYFTGPRAHYLVTCGMRADSVDPAALIERLKRVTSPPDPQSTTSDPDKGVVVSTWAIGGASDTLEVRACKDGRAAVSLTYSVVAH